MSGINGHINQEGCGAQRVIIEAVTPQIDDGLYPVKRCITDELRVEADIFADGHDLLSAALLFKFQSDPEWSEVPMEPLVNDRWRAAFTISSTGTYFYTIKAWINRFRTWRRGLEKKYSAGQDVSIELQIGRELLMEAAARAPEPNRAELQRAADSLKADSPLPHAAQVAIALGLRLANLVDQYAERRYATEYHRKLPLTADPVLARFSAWYELFPRSSALTPGQHGTLRDVGALLPRIARMGFDILYLSPIHPIGSAFRKGRNNALNPQPDDPGSPWAIGSEEGGHKSIHPDLGTVEDFRQLVRDAGKHGLSIALDIAFQCSPDHPYVREHPQWFRHRPDGSIQYAENPPKKYQDIFPLDFESSDWRSLWQELKSIFEFWMAEGIRVFRIDNPHTKSFRFWQWCLAELKAQDPELIFLSEAFTRPKVMYHLAKIGFTQSYNYFPWRNTRAELTAYFAELTQSPVREFFRPNLWPNTPDILTEYMQFGGRPAFVIRLVLAATLGASYGIYGPPYELMENKPREPGSEEYLNSEKYEIRHWPLEGPETLSELICRINRIRRENPALHGDDTLQFHHTDNDQLIAYSKASLDGSNLILVIVNLDPHHTQRGMVTLPIASWRIPGGSTFQFHDLLTEARYLWSSQTNYVELNPQFVPAHVLRLHRHLRTEQDFDYFL